MARGVPGLAPFLAALLLAATVSQAADAAPSRHMISRVNVLEDLALGGTEPFWNLDIKRSGFVFTGVSLPTRRAPRVRPTLSRGRAEWRTRTRDGLAMTVIVTAGPCSDQMSDRIYPLEARVIIGRNGYAGCAATIAAMNRARGRESGEVR